MDLGFSHYRRLYRWISIISHYILVLLCSFLVTVTVGTVVIMIRASFQDRTGRVNSGYREVESHKSMQPKDKNLTNLLENIPQK